MTDNLELNKNDKRLFNILRIIIFALFILGLIYFIYRIFFPSEYFIQSFQNMNSLKNTITDVSINNDISFFASTVQDFSEIKVTIELKSKDTQFKNSTLSLKKSYKAFFYPETSFSSTSSPTENTLASSAKSIFVLSKKEKSPINNPITFIGLGYSWNNIESKKVDLSKYEKNKLLNITSAHPDGTILSTDKDSYYLIENKNKKKLDISLFPQVKNFKNNISVQEKSLTTQENCKLKKNIIFNKKYTCTLILNNILSFSGKDYRIKLSNLPENVAIKEINLEFKKSLNKKNLSLFIIDIKNKLTARFSAKNL